MKTSLQVPFPMSTSLQDNVNWVQQKLGKSPDIHYRPLEIGIYPDTNNIALFYIEGLANYDILNEHISKPLQSTHENESFWQQDVCFHDLLCQAITISDLSFSSEGNDVIAALLAGNTVLIADGYNEAIIAGTAGWEKGPSRSRKHKPLSGVLKKASRKTYERILLYYEGKLDHLICGSFPCVSADTPKRKS